MTLTYNCLHFLVLDFAANCGGVVFARKELRYVAENSFFHNLFPLFVKELSFCQPIKIDELDKREEQEAPLKWLVLCRVQRIYYIQNVAEFLTS